MQWWLGSRVRLIQSMLAERNCTVELVVHADSNAVRLAIETPGVHRMKHIEISQLFIKDLVAQVTVQLQRISSEDNSSDMLTKLVCEETLQKCLLCQGHLRFMAEAAGGRVRLGCGARRSEQRA